MQKTHGNDTDVRCGCGCGSRVGIAINATELRNGMSVGSGDVGGWNVTVIEDAHMGNKGSTHRARTKCVTQGARETYPRPRSRGEASQSTRGSARYQGPSLTLTAGQRTVPTRPL